MKKLNRKGFTLIELLAVIVIMAIIVVVTVPTIINTIADARVNSIWNLAKATANTYDNLVAQDMIASDKVLDEIQIGTIWKCIGNSSPRGGLGVDLVSILDLSVDDLNLGGSYEEEEEQIKLNFNPASDIIEETEINSKTCSAIRVKNNKAEILLVAKDGGKFDVAGKTVYAFSFEDKGVLD